MTESTFPPYDSRQVANSLIAIANRHDQSMSIMRLLKLAYMAHGWALAIIDEPLVNDYVQAWRYGPRYSKYLLCVSTARSVWIAENSNR